MTRKRRLCATVTALAAALFLSLARFSSFIIWSPWLVCDSSCVFTLFKVMNR